MKQILTYINSEKEFNDEHKMAVKIQIDNSLSLGWELENIILVTNFEYKYNGVKAIIIENPKFCEYHFPVAKIYLINYLFKNKLIGNGLYWFHDFDCFELNKIIESEVREEMGSCNIGASNYCQRIRLCSASMFFDKGAEDIFKWIEEECDIDKINEERALMRMYYDKNNSLSSRFKMINTTYAFHKFNIVKTYKTTIKPIRAAHFHLTPDKYDFYVRGNNKLNMPIIPERLIKIFNEHGFKR